MPPGSLVCFSTSCSDIVKYQFWQDGGGLSVAARQLDGCPIIYCPAMAELRKVPLSPKKSKLLELTPTIAADRNNAPHSGQCRHGSNGKPVRESSVEFALPTASTARTMSLGPFPQPVYNTKLSYWVFCFCNNSPNFTSWFCSSGTNSQNDLGHNQDTKATQRSQYPSSFKVKYNLVFKPKCVSLLLYISSNRIFSEIGSIILLEISTGIWFFQKYVQ